MSDITHETGLTLRRETGGLRNKSNQVSAIQREKAGTANYVPHVSAGQVRPMAVMAGQ